MGKYRLQIKKSAGKELEGLDNQADRQRIVARIRALSEDPRPAGCEKLAGGTVEYRVRQGDFRIIYEVHEPQMLVIVSRIRNRKDAYK